MGRKRANASRVLQDGLHFLALLTDGARGLDEVRLAQLAEALPLLAGGGFGFGLRLWLLGCLLGDFVG